VRAMSSITKTIQKFEPFVLGYCKCGCGEQIKINNPKKKKLIFFVNHHNSKGENHPMWNGGKRKDGYGYVLIWKPDHYFASVLGYVKEHRLVYEKHHKCCLLKWGHIHHINGVKDDNRIENIVLLSNAQHRKLHGKIDMSGRYCLLCNSTKTFFKKDKQYFVWYKFQGGFICANCYNKSRL
jgi:hypothetical protein